ncbi:hypothetical protein [Lactobacillus psittaci]|nr:hypothetical protein [Lactobacillus psittaci]
MVTKGFLLAEAAISLLLVMLCLTLVVNCVYEARKVEEQLQLKADQSYANYILKNTDVKRVVVHDREYQAR